MKFGVLATISLAFVLGLPMAGWAGLGQDSDGDGVLDPNDNCTLISNSGAACDTDTDGYGNACDGDYDQSGTVNAVDFLNHFVPDFATNLDSGTGTDNDCSGTVNAIDFLNHFVPQFSLQAPGPSGLGCAGTSPCP